MCSSGFNTVAFLTHHCHHRHQTLPNEIERLLLRPDVSSHVARTFSSAVTPLIERNVRDSINQTLIPAYREMTTEMCDDLYREINEEILNLKKEVVTWQSEALKGQEVRSTCSKPDGWGTDISRVGSITRHGDVNSRALGTGQGVEHERGEYRTAYRNYDAAVLWQ